MQTSSPTSSENYQLGSAADPELAYKIQKRSKLFRFGRHEILFRQGENPHSVYLIQRGEALLTMRVQGVTALRVRAGAGSLLGLPAVVGQKPYTLTAQALGKLEAYWLNPDQFAELLREESKLSMAVLRILASEIRSARQAVAGLADKGLGEP